MMQSLEFISRQLGYKSEVDSTGSKEDGLYEIEIISQRSFAFFDEFVDALVDLDD